MERAGVFIGVARSGTLQELQDAVAGAQRMHAWALTQGMVDGESAALLTDESGPVTLDMVSEAVEKTIDTVAPEQLIVYFAGHGVARRAGEFWLLSKAPGNPTHAVDVRASCDLARYGQVPHVVLISDACRTAPEGIQAQAVTGGPIFPNLETDKTSFVDVFFACRLGRPALEIQDPGLSADSYRAVYTEVLLEVLSGRYADALEPIGSDALIAECRKVRNTLSREVPGRIHQKGLSARYGQVPEAAILSDPGAWLGLLPAGGGDRAVTRGPVLLDSFAVPESAAPGPEWGPEPDLLTLEEDLVVPAQDLLLQDFGPDHFETGCGLKVRGDEIADLLVPDGDGYAEDVGDPSAGRLVLATEGSTVLVRLRSGIVLVVPVLQDYLTALEVEDGDVWSVSWELSSYSDLFTQDPAGVQASRQARARIAAVRAHGAFALQERAHEVDDVQRMLHEGTALDPAAALHLAYTAYQRGDPDSVTELRDLVRSRLGVAFFDIEMLAGRLSEEADVRVLPGFPMLSQGWSLLRGRAPHAYDQLRDVIPLTKDSYWTSFDPAAVDLLADLMTWRGQS